MCRGRRVYQNKMPSRIPVQVYTLYDRRDKKHKRIKNFFLKICLSLAEVFAN